MSATTGSGTFVCPMCGETIRFLIDIETDADGNLYSSRAKGVGDDHAPTCKAYVADSQAVAS